ncbi:sarcolemmal membrane-associated protein-like [Sinocyclocheilus rhinocerous]|uniref:sarcolemmal membrane-associated protein-like n=1 Tax=Sinocyclocheilus rhinocerous TaxID=307959 RepID=UPI0007B8F4C7|nr:PREDICTED: sarcolemmal membrane-associated protein-like [Sinocyclocheilus rhinocerous]
MPSALAVFTCRPNSHPFQERHVYLDEPVKIGRSVARCRPAQNNATFDCKVLSRNHALVWFDHKTGKVSRGNTAFLYSLYKTCTQNSSSLHMDSVRTSGIFYQSLDIFDHKTLSFKTFTHGCIVSTIKLFLPDGMEARRRSDVVPAPLPLAIDKVSANTPSMYSQELFQLSQYLQEALHREQMLEQKLATLQRLLHSTQEASESSWQALIDEDRLLSRLEVMGNQLQAYSKNQTEDGIRKELVALTEDKHNYETTAKESLRRVLQEKIEVVRKLSEVERSLSNTEDECTHLREMNERTQEELRELANKYNGAVNEIKDLTEKIKACLPFTQCPLQEKSIKENNSLDHFLLKSGGDCTLIQQYIECQCEYTAFFPTSSSAVLINHLMNQHQRRQQLFSFYSVKGGSGLFRSASIENQIDAKESDMSDTLSPSKDKSSDDTSDGQMDEQELNEPQNRVSLLKEMDRNLEAGDTEQVIPHFHRELQEAQELANTGKQKCLELQALLEEERRTNRQQTEESAKQIRFLQTQLAKLQSDMEALREQRENTITTTREELYSAQEEILLLRHAMEAATAEREREIAALQGDLSAVAAELDKWRQTAAKYEVEISNLQASFQLQSQHQERASQLQGELEKLQAECSSLQNECDSLRAEKTTLMQKLHRLEEELDSSRERSATLSSSLNALEKSQGDLENKLGSIRDQHQQDASKLKIQLAQAESHTRDLQKEYDDTQNLLSDLRQQYEQTEQEKHSINDELEQCKVNLKFLQEKGSNSGWMPWMPVVAAVVAVTAVVLYPNLSKSSS